MLCVIYLFNNLNLYLEHIYIPATAPSVGQQHGCNLLAECVNPQLGHKSRVTVCADGVKMSHL